MLSGLINGRPRVSGLTHAAQVIRDKGGCIPHTMGCYSSVMAVLRAVLKLAETCCSDGFHPRGFSDVGFSAFAFHSNRYLLHPYQRCSLNRDYNGSCIVDVAELN